MTGGFRVSGVDENGEYLIKIREITIGGTGFDKKKTNIEALSQIYT